MPDTSQELFRSLRHRNFRLFFGGYAVSLVGVWLQMSALSWLVWRITGSGTKLGLIRFLEQFPIFIFAPLAGVLADRVSRHRLVLVTQCLAMIQAIALAAVVLMGVENFEVIAALALFMGLILAFDMPARQSFVVEMVGRDDLGNAIALNSFLFNAARIVGPLIFGFIIARGGSEGICFLINGLSFILVISMLTRIRVEPTHDPSPEGSMAAHFLEAVRFTHKHAAFKETLAHICAISLMGFPFLAILPMVATDVLGREAQGYAFMLTCAGIGAILSAIFLARGVAWLGQGRLLPVSGVIFGFCLLLFSFSRIYWLSCLLTIPTAGLMMMQVVGTNTFIQKLVPDRLRGRVISFFYMLSLGVLPVGSLAVGWMADRFGDPLIAIRIGGACCVLASSVAIARLPIVRASVGTLQRLQAET